MRKIFLNRRRQRLSSSLLLGLLLFRAYVPAGFMPASGAPFLLELCPASGSLPTSMTTALATATPTAMDMPMDMSMPMPMRMPMDGVAHHQHSGAHGCFDHCPFGSVPGAGPISPVIAVEPPPRIACALKVAASAPLYQPRRKDPAHPTRGPPPPSLA